MAYNNTYVATDVSAVTIDFITGTLVALVGFVTIIGLVMLFRWLKGKKLF